MKETSLLLFTPKSWCRFRRPTDSDSLQSASAKAPTLHHHRLRQTRCILTERVSSPARKRQNLELKLKVRFSYFNTKRRRRRDASRFLDDARYSLKSRPGILPTLPNDLSPVRVRERLQQHCSSDSPSGSDWRIRSWRLPNWFWTLLPLPPQMCP